MCDEKGCNGTTLIAFLAGGLIGAGIALLTAPVSGREAREKISDLAGDIKEKATGWTDDVRAKVGGLLERESAAVKEAYEAGREAMARERAKFEGGTPE
jgi:gas vesicle protein